MPWEGETDSVDTGGDGEVEENKPAIKQVDKTVAIVDESAKEPEEEPEEEPEIEGLEEVNETASIMVEFQPPALLLDCNGGCERHGVYDEENDVVIAAINQSRLIMAKEAERITLHSVGCNESEGEQVTGKFLLDGEEYWINYPAAFKRDWADYVEFEGNESGFSLHEGEMQKSGDTRVYLWKIVPGAFVCDANVEISIFEEVVILEEWMEGVVLGLEENEGELRLSYLMYPEGTLD
ncbi:MAG: hypothetical protein GY852_00070 [bacterium]|nr:hypothetical protein [bacterium]